jgi:1-aminocyclopropane-1-carboxylate deaminase
MLLCRMCQLRLPGSQISGNKARKMLSLQTLSPHIFPRCVASYGGPQSNAMLALAAVVHYQNTLLSLAPGDSNRKRFIYYTKKLPRFLRDQPSGNLFRAQALGMELVELTTDEYNRCFGNEWGGTGDEAPLSLAPPVPGDSVWIPQGGACSVATAGTRRLAREILDYWTLKGAQQPLSICIPSGTCSTALLVHQALQEFQSTQPEHKILDIKVVVVPCVGDESYARRQMMYLNSQIFGSDSNQIDDIPTVLRPTPMTSPLMTSPTILGDCDYFRFGEPDPSILATFRELHKDHDLVLDLLYGAPAWTILLRNWSPAVSARTSGHAFDPEAPLDGRRIMYVHSGGLEGINSQLLRYKYKNLVDKDEIQLPGRNVKI